MFRERLSRMAVGAVLALPVPVLGGDWPDPSVIRDGPGYAAVTTSGGWAPSFRILRSPDLRDWRLAGSVFRRAPRWTRNSLWAPELTRLGGGYAVFYSASRRRKGYWFCLGVATAPSLSAHFRDAGRPLRCGRYGSIDPYPVRDERGRLHLLWKEDGNAFDRPARIIAQRLSEDGRHLRGRPVELLRNRVPWEGRVVEAPGMIRRNGYFYLFYAGNLCCTEDCAYAVGVARSRTLLGRFRRFPGNPILRGGNGWRCPGHASFVPDAAGRYRAVFHAYGTGAGLLVGRQLLVEDVSFGSDGWPRIGTGLPASPLAGGPTLDFSDSFAGPGLAPEWEWPVERVPGRLVEDGLRLTGSPRGGTRLDAGVVARRIGSDRYSATATVDRMALSGRTLGGLASYRTRSVGIGVAVGRQRLIVWRRRKGRYRLLAEAAAPITPLVHLRMTSRGRLVSFEYSSDGLVWKAIGPEALTPVEESARVALTAGGRRRAVVRFTRASMTTEVAPPPKGLGAPR